MDILDFVRQFCTDLQLAKKTKYQYGVLAFDLGEVGPDPHAPECKPVTVVDERIGAAGPSGPWVVQNRNWSPVDTLVVKEGSYALDKKGDYRAETYGKSEKICSERWLLGGISGYLKPYYAAYGRFPLSVSLYSVMTPCKKCNAYMRRFPSANHTVVGQQASGTIGRWYFAYSDNYDWNYDDVATGDAATAELGLSGWVVRKDT
jgi:hypothetical protein